ncbi:helix-turn-helix domain-containing protein [Paraburkholderia sp. BCC1885]|uniref:helix-turn-helix domain-containing protein n=1 Tax=Paraburkholderia sp. BCC1885 TaxID=2562669 RepID=UPI0011833C0A|nr:helix-turn-helix domain-containing protein [Paraburkholderia sp. BCC1885]
MMTRKRQRPSSDQWARLDAALEGLRERNPPGTASPLSREITRRADALRAALESGWRIRDLAAFFKESAEIDVSPSTIQTALRQALIDSTSKAKRPRAKRPRKRSAHDNAPAATATSSVHESGTGPAPAPDSRVATTAVKADVPHPRTITPLGSTLTQGATKRGQR